MGTLDGKVALVTGAGRGIGAAIARKLAASGAKVVVSDLDPDPAAETAAAITGQSGSAVTLVGDVAVADFGERAVAAALEAFGDLDIIVNNAGYIWNSAIQNMSDAQWYAMIDVHATAPFRILRAAQPHFRAAAKREEEAGKPKHRKVVNISSVSGLYGAATQFAYSAAKASLIGVTRTLAKEWGRFRVNVNCVAFGYIDTRLTQEISGETVVMIEGEAAARNHHLSLDAAAEQGKRDTRHYAKRQFTWFRHQLGDWPRVDPHAAFDDVMRAAGR